MLNTHKRTKYSNIMMIVFFIALGTSAFYSDFFQSPLLLIQNKNHKLSIFTKGTLKNYQTIIFKNPLGSFTAIQEGQGQWSLTVPQHLTIKQESLFSLLNEIENAKIVKTFSKDTINLSNFSLEKPQSTITFKTNDKEVTFELGIKNPIDHTTFVTTSSSNLIYQIESFQNKIEAITFLTLIQTNLLDFKLENLQQLTITQNQAIKFNIRLDPTSRQWSLNGGPLIEKDKINRYLEDLSQLKAFALLDQTTMASQDKIHQALKINPMSLSITRQDGHQETFTISKVIPKLPEIKINIYEFFIIKSESTDAIYLFSPSDYDVVSKRFYQI